MIRVLDSFISDKIAAGEVIERPVSAVKELIENSIDAAASSIIVEVKGASSYIRITDNGCGIASDEIENAFLRHATSKISKVTDLDNIRSLGFRGEALASISAVSRLTIVSRTKDEISGTKLVLHAGRLISREKLGSNTGTTIVVEDLFYNTPARRKFMKSDAREASAIIELVQQYAICYPDIRFMMINNSVTLFSTDGNGDAASVIRTLYPDNAHSSLIQVNG
ncbi:MAG: ATP-binding protein, partial [Mogibacterium sp.]|nr:ATP-binding protein [Mogibacterium sp.]